MHNKAKLIFAVILAMLLVPPQVSAQSKIKQTLRNIFTREKKMEVESSSEDNIALRLSQPKPKLDKVDYLTITGFSLNSFWGGDIWAESGSVPPISIPLEEGNGPEIYTGSFDIAEYTKFVLSLEEDEDEVDYTETPEEYSIWTNSSINSYNVRLSESMKDTVRIDVSSYTSPGYRYVTSEFGGRWGRLHAGIDLKVFIGDTIRSAFEKGIVRIRKFDRRGYGHYVVVRHENGLETLYCHMSKILVEEGQQVKAGEPIGLGGNTGRSTGPHLHFELRYLGNPINPRDAIDFNKGTVHDKTLILTVDNFKYQNIKFSKKSKSKSKVASSKKSKTKGKKTAKVSTRKGKGTTITVRKGDTLGAIARRYGTTVAKIQKLNGLKNTKIRAGQKLRVK